MVDWIIAGAFTLSLCSVTLSVWVSRQAIPAQYARRVAETTHTLRAAETAVIDLQSQWRTYRAGLDGTIEELSHMIETVEKKRRQTAASTAKAEKLHAEQPQEDLDPYLDLRRRARAQGIPV